MDLLLSLVLAVVAMLAAWLLAFGDADRVGVAGTLLGGVVGFLAASIVERSRRRHEDEHRFEADRRAAYVRLLEASEAVERVIRDRHVAASVRRERPELADRVNMPERPDMSRVDLIVYEIRLLAPFPVYASASIVDGSLTGLDYAIDGADEEGWSKASSDLNAARSEFIERAKRDLGTPTGVMTRWQARRHGLKKRLGLTKPKKKPTTPA